MAEAVNDGSMPVKEELVEDLKSQLEKAQGAADEYQRQLLFLQQQLEEALQGQAELQAATITQGEQLKALQSLDKSTATPEISTRTDVEPVQEDVPENGPRSMSALYRRKPINGKRSVIRGLEDLIF